MRQISVLLNSITQALEWAKTPLLSTQIVFKCPPDKIDADRFYEETLGLCVIIANKIIHDLYSRGTPDDVRIEISFASAYRDE